MTRSSQLFDRFNFTFRENRIALSADIDAMLMQAKVKPCDQPFLRYIWKNERNIETHQYISHTFGTTDSPCIASYALRRCSIDSSNNYPCHKIGERNIYIV